VIYLQLDDLLHIAERVLGRGFTVRDSGLLESVLARPRASAGGRDAYTSIHEKAAALLLSLCRNHGVVDGNKRLALAAVLAFYGMNGYRLTMSNDDAYDLVAGIAAGGPDDVPTAARALRGGSTRRG
jgi:death on curing protein